VREVGQDDEMDHPLRDSETSRGSFEIQDGLKELAWLSPEQQTAVEAKALRQQHPRTRHGDSSASPKHVGSSGGTVDAARRASHTMVEMAGSLSRSAADAAELAARALAFDPHTSGGSGAGGGMPNGVSGSRSGSIVSDSAGTLLDLDEGSNSAAGGAVDPQVTPSLAAGGAVNPQVTPSLAEDPSLQQFFVSPVDHDDDSTASSGGDGSRPVTAGAYNGEVKVNCLRCGGTVEGPKNSTCACKLPLVADMSTEAGRAINAQAAIHGGETESAKWGRRKQEARLQAEKVTQQLSVSMTSMSQTMGRFGAAASASIGMSSEGRRKSKDNGSADVTKSHAENSHDSSSVSGGGTELSMLTLSSGGEQAA
jgi:hypothetical protein